MPEIVQKILKNQNNLSCNFHVAVKVSEMLEDFNISIDDLAKIIEIDPSITAKLLKHCNSAEYGFSRKITSIRDAVARLGFKSLKTILFTIVSQGSLSQEMEGYGLEKGELFSNSISCAVYSRYLAEFIEYPDPDQAFTAGLLRDLGKLMIHEYVREEYDEIIKLINDEKIPFSEAEEKILGLNHCQIGAIIGEKWNFPQILIDVIKYHHQPEKAEEAGCEDVNLVKIVHFADYLTVMLGYGIGKDGMMYEIDFKALESLGFELSSENIELLISDIVNLNSEIESMTSSSK